MYYNQYHIVQNIVTKHIICFLAGKYVVLEKNELCYDQNIIDDENECKFAARSTGISTSTGSETSAWWPRGCYVAIDSNTTWFNSHPVGNREKRAAPICRRGKFMCV